MPTIVSEVPHREVERSAFRSRIAFHFGWRCAVMKSKRDLASVGN
jgi:hypothetical protein